MRTLVRSAFSAKSQQSTKCLKMHIVSEKFFAFQNKKGTYCLLQRIVGKDGHIAKYEFISKQLSASILSNIMRKNAFNALKSSDILASFLLSHYFS